MTCYRYYNAVQSTFFQMSEDICADQFKTRHLRMHHDRRARGETCGDHGPLMARSARTPVGNSMRPPLRESCVFSYLNYLTPWIRHIDPAVVTKYQYVIVLILEYIFGPRPIWARPHKNLRDV